MLTSSDLVITCFPKRWGEQKADPLNVLDGIIEETNAKTGAKIETVYDLAILITSRCSGIFDRHRLGDQEYQFLDMFESSISHVTDRETRLFARFDRASAMSSRLLHHQRHHFETDALPMPPLDDDDDDDDREGLDILLDIGVETSLLTEIKDIRDELNIIAHILDSQTNIADQAEQNITDELRQGTEAGNRRALDGVTLEIRKRCRELRRLLDIHKKDVDRMDRQAESIYMSLTHLLDLKQKHSNALEARFARAQAEIAAKQGQTIMVFTIVTIIFLPMGFIASVFAINLSDWQGDPLTFAYVSKWVFGMGLAISIPLVTMAFTVTDIQAAFRRTVSLLYRKRNGKKKKTGDDSDDEVPEKLDGHSFRRSSAGHDLPRSRPGGGRYESSDGGLGVSLDRDFEHHSPSRLSPVLARIPRPRGYSGSSGKAVSWSRPASYERRARASQDLERGSAGSPSRY